MLEGREGFAAYVAHELRGPIALQRALVEVTLANPNADTAALREMGERVVASCTHQQRLIEALLDLARSGRGLARREPVDLAVIAAAALRAHDLSELGSVVALEPVQTTGDPQLLERLAANLVSNAIQHNIAGGRDRGCNPRPVRARRSLRCQHRPADPARRTGAPLSTLPTPCTPTPRHHTPGSDSASPSFKRSPTHTAHS